MHDFAGMASVFTLILFSYVLLRLGLIEKQTSRLSRIEAKLDLLLKQAGLSYDPLKELPAQIMEALVRGEKIQAIKLYREVTGVGLSEAKAFIEDLQRKKGLSA